MKIVSKFIDYLDEDTAVVIGSTVPGDIIVDGGIHFMEVFNGTTPIVDVGFASDNAGGAADPNALGTAMLPTAIGNVPFDAIKAVTNIRCTVADQVTATYSNSGGTATTGKAIVWFAAINALTVNDDS